MLDRWEVWVAEAFSFLPVRLNTEDALSWLNFLHRRSCRVLNSHFLVSILPNALCFMSSCNWILKGNVLSTLRKLSVFCDKKGILVKCFLQHQVRVVPKPATNAEDTEHSLCNVPICNVIYIQQIVSNRSETIFLLPVRQRVSRLFEWRVARRRKSGSSTEQVPVGLR